MYALTWKRQSGRIHEELILCARGLIPSLRGSRTISTATSKSVPKLPSNPGGTHLGKTRKHGRLLVGHFLPLSIGGLGEKSVRKSSAQGCSLIEKGSSISVFRGLQTSSASFQFRCSVVSEPYRRKAPLQLPVGFTRCVSSSGDRDDRESDERHQKIPFASGEGDENDKENKHVLSMKDIVEEGPTNQSTTLTEELGGGADDGEDYREQSHLLREVGWSKAEDEKERIISEEANAKAHFWAQKARFKKEFEKRVVDWESLEVDLQNFPYYLSDSTRDLLVDCVGSHLRQPDFAAYGSGLPSSSRRIMIYGQSGSELYQEKLVEAVARHLQGSLLVIDSTVLSPHDFGDQESSSDSDVDGNEESRYEEWGENDSKWQEKDSSLESSNEETEESDTGKHSDDETYRTPVVTLLGVTSDSAEAIRRKLLEVFGGLVNVLEVHNQKAAGDLHEQEHDDPASDFSVKKGDRVKYVGGNSDDSTYRHGMGSEPGALSDGAHSGRQVLKAGQRGRVVSVPKHMTGKVGVKFDRLEGQSDNLSKDDKKTDDTQKPDNLIEWCDLSDLEPDDRPAIAHTEEWFAALEALCEVASATTKPLIIYLPDPRQWFERAVPLEQRQEFLMQVEHKLDQLVGPVVMIAGRTNEEDPDSDDRKRLKAHLEHIRDRLNIKSSAKLTVRELLGTDDIYELFVNTVNVLPPQEEAALQDWNNQLTLHKGVSQAKWNLRLLNKVLELHNMECPDLNSIDLYGLRVTSAKAENVVGWARNHFLASCVSTPTTNNGKLMIPRDSLERALTRLRDIDNKKSQPVTKDYKTVAEDEYEKALITAVIPPHEVGVKFDHIGSLDNVKQALRELVMLPLQRPELFSKGNLTRPCKGVLLFGPPGTGKTLLAKAVATEAGANFINITGSTITSKWFGDAEKLTKALFSLAKKLSPAVIFVDEVDSLLGARGGSSEHEATRKTRNEFMAAWDGLRSKDNERVLVLAATNRPFDLDDAVIRRLSRRILVDLPTGENRVKILRVILAEEELEQNFDFEELARMTEGYSGSDLKNLSIAAAYRPIRELLDAEAKAQAASTVGVEAGAPQMTRGSSTTVIRALRLDDFREGMQQVGASIAYDASSMNELRRWNEQYGEGGSRRRSSFGFTV